MIRKPKWNKAPNWANYLAMDEDGVWHWFEIAPVKRYGMPFWMNVSGGRVELAQYGDKKPHEGWRSTLEKRP